MKQDPCNTEVKHGFSRTVAKRYGVNAAIVLGYLSYKIHHSQNERDGKKWYYGTLDEITKAFPYLKRSAVYEALKQLTGECGVLITGIYNKKKYDRTTWYAFKNKAASELAERSVIYYKVQDAALLDVAKAVLLGNLRYLIDKNKHKNPNNSLHPMSPTELADVLPFSRATIQRKLKELVEADGELVSVTALDGRDPSRYGFADDVEWNEDFATFRAKTFVIPSKTDERPPQPRINNLAGSEPNQSASSPNAEGSNPDNYTTLVDNPLKEPFRRFHCQASEPLLRRGSDSSHLSLLAKQLDQSPAFNDTALNDFSEQIGSRGGNLPDALHGQLVQISQPITSVVPVPSLLAALQ